MVLRAPTGDLRVIVSSSDAMRLLELFELQAAEGPCLDCVRDGRRIANVDLAQATSRWPRFAPLAVETGFRRVHAVPMRLRGEVIGALNLFHDTTATMADEDVQLAQALADVATISIIQHRTMVEARELNAQLNRALESRLTIEQAKGIVAEQAGLDMQDAFHRLRSHARNSNRRLADVARDVVAGRLNATSLQE